MVGLGLLAAAGQAGFTASAHIYVVQPGDSLWRISGEYHLTVAQLAAANDMQASDLLLIGRRLVIPGTESSTVAAASLASAFTGAGSPASGSPGAFCSEFTPQSEPYGVLPYPLAYDPSELAIRPYFVEWANAYGVSPALVEAIAWQESGWQEGVVSSADAIGVGQLLPSTASFVSQSLGEYLNINSTSDNIRMSAAYLAYLQRVEGGNLCRTIAAYYEGPVNMSRYGVLYVAEPYVANVEALLPRFE
ncbi:MAG: lytic transglycosylase domain-containing protein [Acidimicrobiales bacterium]